MIERTGNNILHPRTPAWLLAPHETQAS